MKKYSLLAFLFSVGLSTACAAEPPPRFGLVLHGGAGVIERQNMSPGREAEIRHQLNKALTAGYEVLAKGGPALEAVTAAINVLEDSPLFNAGCGAVAV